MIEKQVRPPYASADGVRTLFEKMKALGPPNAVDSDWVSAYKIQNAQPQAIVGVLKWLGVADKAGAVDKELWKSLRTSQVATLEELVRRSYSAVFEAVDVATADLDTLKGGFINAFDSGDPAKPVAAFLTLCELAGIDSAAHPRPHAMPSASKVGKAPSTATTSSATTKRSPKENPPRSELSVTLQVVVPPEWDSDQIKERLDRVAEAVARFQDRV